MYKKGITLIQLMVVIIVLGIISLIALPNIKNIKNKARLSAAMENKTTVQKAVDKYYLDNQKLPTLNNPTAEVPAQLNWNKLAPSYIKSRPSDLGKIYYWVDYNNTVWASDVDAPQGIMVDFDGVTVLWDTVNGATGYEVGYIEEMAKVSNGKLVAGHSYKSLGTCESSPFISNIDLTGKTVVVKAIDKNFESVPVGMGYSGYTPETTSEQSNTTNHKPVAVISMTPEQALTTTTSITWGYENSADEDGDQIINAEWDGVQGMYTTEGTYTVKLRVQDSKGSWSDWAEKTFYVVNAKGIKQISAGGNFTLALFNDGTAKSWGYNAHGELGIGTINNASTPVVIPGLNNVKQISAGSNHSFALMNDGTVKAWGLNNNGQLGNGTTTNSLTPIIIGGLNNVIKIECGSSHTLFLLNDGTIKVCGLNTYGQVGDGTTVNKLTAVTVMTGVTDIATGYYHSFAIMEDGSIKAWGMNSYGQLGDGTSTNQTSPVTVSGLSNVKKISGGGYFTLALLNDGTVRAWGYNTSGQLGNGTTTKSLIPITVSGLNNVKDISAGSMHSLALINDGSLKVWGANTSGKLGDGTTTQALTPKTILYSVQKIIAGGTHSIAILNDDTVKIWGLNTNGQLGDGTLVNKSTPTLINIGD